MPRPKGSKNHSNRILSTPSSTNPIPLTLSIQTSVLTSTLNNSNDEYNWISTSMSRSGRPKKNDFNTENDDNLIPTSSSSVINGNHRVVINPAVLRYLEQNRNIDYSCHTSKTNEFDDKNQSIEERDDSIFDDLLTSVTIELVSPNEQQSTTNELIELDNLIQDDLFWDFCTYSTDFLPCARLAEWILTHQ
ncbi:hypothetical protein I4U23_014447 [Adineta vaga]|nr:hypothetical protein I4U23_014447 [Adineta vaga]